MLKLQTPVEAGRSKFGISYSDKILVLGSCFADNMGKKLDDAGFDVLSNPFGTLYNPVSICNSLQRIASMYPFSETDCVKMGAGAGLYCSFWHHSSFAAADKADFLDKANRVLSQAGDFYKDSSKILITLGTSWCYRFNENGQTVSNCLKRPAAEFSRYRLSVSEILTLLSLMVERNLSRKFIFTVSPIRHMKDGAHGNQLSKSALLLAVESLCEKYPDNVEYFPAYEIVMDELRDYRFYADDMLHPSGLAVDYLWERFMSFALPEEQRAKLLEAEKSYRQSQHRPLHQETV